MEESLTENDFFWKGIAAGFLAGIGVAAVLRYTPFEKLLSGTVEGKLETPPSAPMAIEDPGTPRLESPAFVSRRDHPESAGDPRGLASDRTGASAEFVRRGGAPGGRTDAEVLEVPGHPGEIVDHIDLSQPNKRYRRYFDMGSAG